MESRNSTESRNSIELRTEKIVIRRNRTNYKTTLRYLSRIATTLFFLARVTIVVSQTPDFKDEFELLNMINDGFSGDMERYKHALSECAQQNNATKDDITKFLRNKPQDTDQGKCFVACVMKRIGILKNGKIDAESYMNSNRKVYGEDLEIMDHLKMAMQECLEFNEGFEECEYASFFNDCVSLKTNHILKRVHRNQQKKARTPTKKIPKKRANKIIKDEL